jgi:hypothetical protein
MENRQWSARPQAGDWNSSIGRKADAMAEAPARRGAGFPGRERRPSNQRDEIAISSSSFCPSHFRLVNASE